MEFPITPYQSAGPIKLGMRQDEVRQAMSSTRITADYFEEYEISVDYNDCNRCKRIFLRVPANPTFLGKSLLKGHSFDKLYQWFKSIDDSVILGDIQFVSFKFGISLFTPSAESHGKKRPNAVAIFEEGDFDYIKTHALLERLRNERRLG